MKILKNREEYLQFNPYEEKEIGKYEDENQLIFIAPDRCWDDKSICELEEADVHICGLNGVALMRYYKYIVVGKENHGVVMFKKTGRPLGFTKSRDFANTYNRQSAMELEIGLRIMLQNTGVLLKEGD